MPPVYSALYRLYARQACKVKRLEGFIINFLLFPIFRCTLNDEDHQGVKSPPPGAVRENPAEAFAKGGNSDEQQDVIRDVGCSCL